jgi:hypothetical protein
LRSAKRYTTLTEFDHATARQLAIVPLMNKGVKKLIRAVAAQFDLPDDPALRHSR